MVSAGEVSPNWNLFRKKMGWSLNKGNGVSKSKLIAKNDVEDGKKNITKYLAIDCEMVGAGLYGYDSVLARVSIVNYREECIYDTFVKPTLEITDYRTKFSGVTKKDLKKCPQFQEVQKAVYEMTKGHILVGHGIENDLKALKLQHPKNKIRDTSSFRPFLRIRGAKPSLKRLVNYFLGINIQGGEHDSIEDAKYTMKIFKLYEKEWEKSLRCRDKRKEILDKVSLSISELRNKRSRKA
ncbi:MAG: REX4, RNA exonuclease 4 [Marteilia pararefringens]